VIVCGLALDVCVKATMLEARREGFATWLLEELSAAVDPAAVAECRREFEEVGVEVIT
jgi:nicotinamidase/pyrazinamidase